MGELQCEVVLGWGSCGVGMLWCGGIAEWGDLQYRGATVWGSCSVGELLCGGVAV